MGLGNRQGCGAEIAALIDVESGAIGSLDFEARISGSSVQLLARSQDDLISQI